MSNISENPNQAEVDRLRIVADFLEKHPNIGRVAQSSVPCVTLFHEGKESLVEAMRRIGGSWTKDADQYYFTVRQQVGDVAVYMHVTRSSVCERRVTKKLIPARPETILPAQPETVVDEVEWICPESILQAADAALVAAEPVVFGVKPALAAEADIEVLEREKQEAVLARPERFDPL